ncbi:hypothetical protein V6N11_055427 [Hibiscus sabdariffa]|uniref:Uncharacterized protein n=1 Tax=Hibiscus sabdariffa TaxID=183260 RepID=A0ABR2PFA3_9ROSI
MVNDGVIMAKVDELEDLVEDIEVKLEVDVKTRKMFIEGVMKLVELSQLRHVLVGLSSVNGLLTEQRKSFTIVIELVTNPSIIFIYEPTSMHDTKAATTVMRLIKNIVDTGRTIVCTIHQPSIGILEAFDELYLRPFRHHSKHLIKYFEAIQGVRNIRDGYSPTTWMLEVTASACELSLGVDVAGIYKNSNLYGRNKALIEDLSKLAHGTKELYFPTEFSQSS